MTVKELKEKLEQYPDDYVIYTLGDYCNETVEGTVIREYEDNGIKGIIIDEY